MSRHVNTKATEVSRDEINLINGITIKESVAGLEVRLGFISYDEKQSLMFGYGHE